MQREKKEHEEEEEEEEKEEEEVKGSNAIADESQESSLTSSYS